jgi:hypothetical protein
MSLRVLPRLGVGLLTLTLLAVTGCRYSAASGLPDHIRTVRVATFENDTMHVGMESAVTRAVIQELANDPGLRLVQHGEDALLTGRIVDVQQRVLRQTRKDTPASIRLNLIVEVTFEDRVSGKRLLDEQRITSAASSSAAGVYDFDRGQSRSEAEERAVSELAAEIVRQTAGMW